MAIQFRKASSDDHASVMAIAEKAVIYGGNDYLPFEFDGIMRRHGGYVLETDDRVVGFLAYAITDGGTSFNPIGGRVHDDYRNRGLFRYLMETVTQKVRAAHPEVTTRRMLTAHSNPYLERILTTHEIIHRGYFLLAPADEARKRHVSHLCQFDGNPTIVSRWSTEDLRRFWESEDPWRHLFPTGYLIQDWRVYKFNPADIGNLFV